MKLCSFFFFLNPEKWKHSGEQEFTLINGYVPPTWKLKKWQCGRWCVAEQRFSSGFGLCGSIGPIPSRLHVVSWAETPAEDFEESSTNSALEPSDCCGDYPLLLSHCWLALVPISFAQPFGPLDAVFSPNVSLMIVDRCRLIDSKFCERGWGIQWTAECCPINFCSLQNIKWACSWHRLSITAIPISISNQNIFTVKCTRSTAWKWTLRFEVDRGWNA